MADDFLVLASLKEANRCIRDALKHAADHDTAYEVIHEIARAGDTVTGAATMIEQLRQFHRRTGGT